MQRRCTITTATLAGVSANITQPSIHPVYAKCANDGYLLFQASVHGQRPKRPLSSGLNRLPACPTQFPMLPFAPCTSYTSMLSYASELPYTPAPPCAPCTSY